MQSILGIGVDLVEVGRFRRMLSRYEDSLSGLLFTSHEMAACEGDSRRHAGLFAVKESVAKALGVGLHYISPNGIHARDVEAQFLDKGRVQIVLSGMAEAVGDRMGVEEWCVTSAVRGSYVMALAVASGNRRLDANMLLRWH